MKPATCHPDRPYRAKGLCGKCYAAQWWDRYGEQCKRKQREYYHKNPKVLEQKRAWRRNNPEKVRLSGLKYRWVKWGGQSKDGYEQMLAVQNGVCAICERSDVKLCIDHDHKANVVRGLLCYNCNLVLGLAKDSIKNLIAAARYLEKHGTDERAV